MFENLGWPLFKSSSVIIGIIDFLAVAKSYIVGVSWFTYGSYFWIWKNTGMKLNFTPLLIGDLPFSPYLIFCQN